MRPRRRRAGARRRPIDGSSGRRTRARNQISNHGASSSLQRAMPSQALSVAPSREGDGSASSVAGQAPLVFATGPVER